MKIIEAAVSIQENTVTKPKGGVCQLVYLFDGDVAFFGVMFPRIFFETYKRGEALLELVVI